MPRVGQIGAADVSYIGNGSANAEGFSLSNAAGWTMIWWILSIIIIVAMFMAL